MYKDLEETFTCDLRYRNEVVSLNHDSFLELEERIIEQPSFSQEDINLVWDTLDELYGKSDEHYILVYLVFYLGFSYRDAAAVVGRVVSYVHKTVQQSIKEVREALREHGKPID